MKSISKPYLIAIRQGDPRSPFICSFCNTNQEDMINNKKKDEYYCECSFWSSSNINNPWIRWRDRERLIKILEYELGIHESLCKELKENIEMLKNN